MLALFSRVTPYRSLPAVLAKDILHNKDIRLVEGRYYRRHYSAAENMSPKYVISKVVLSKLPEAPPYSYWSCVMHVCERDRRSETH